MIQQCSRVFMLSFLFLDWTLCTSFQESRRWLLPDCPEGTERQCIPHTFLCSCQPKHVNGGWSEWSSSPCSATCGDGTKIETRSCTNPAPSHGGTSCEGESVRVTPCHTGQCPTTTSIPTKCSSDVNCTGFNCPRQHYPFCEPNLEWSACGCTECTDGHHCNCPTGMIGHCRNDIFIRKCECRQLPGFTCKRDSDCSTHVCRGNISQSFCHEKKFLVYDFSSCDCRECSKDSDCHCQQGLIPSCQITVFGSSCHCKQDNAQTTLPTTITAATCASRMDCNQQNTRARFLTFTMPCPVDHIDCVSNKCFCSIDKITTTFRAASTTTLKVDTTTSSSSSVGSTASKTPTATTTPVPTATRTTAMTTTTHQTSGKPCPFCDTDMNCVWNQTCADSETCMVRGILEHGFQFSVHCILSSDCHLMTTYIKSAEIYCCDDRSCLQRYLPGV